MKLTYLSLLLLSVLVSLAAIPAAQLGEQAGQPNMNVPLGGSATFNYSILNAGASPINFTVILPTLNTIPHNTTPTVAVTPMSGTLAPYSQHTISIMVSLSGSDKTNLTWQGVLQVVEATPQTVSSGGASATITAGVAKILTIHSVAPKGWPIIYFVVLFAAVAVVISAASYLLFMRKKKTARILIGKRDAEAQAIKRAVKRSRKSGRKGTARRKGTSRRAATKKGGARRRTTTSARRRKATGVRRRRA